MGNTLFVEVKMHATQISLNSSQQNSQKLNLCHPEIFSLSASTDRIGSLQRCSRQPEPLTNGNEYIYTMMFLIENFVLDDNSESERMNITMSKLSKLKNETIFINYIEYKVLAKWNEKDVNVASGMKFKNFVENGVEKACIGCSKLSG